MTEFSSFPVLVSVNMNNCVCISPKKSMICLFSLYLQSD